VASGSGLTAQVERDLVRRCHGGLDVAGVRRLALGSLRRLMPVDAVFFATADPETLLFTGGHAEEPLATSQQRFLDNEFGGADVNRFAALATAPTHVARLDSATRGQRRASARYRDIMAPLGLGDELRAALVVGSRCWGYLCLHRADDPRGFSEAEAALVARLSPHLAHALRQAVLLHGTSGGQQTGAKAVGPGVVLLEQDSSVAAVTESAHLLLSLVEDGRGAQCGLPVAVYAVAAALSSIERGEPGSGLVPSTRVRTSDGGWLNLHASRLHSATGPDRTAVVVEAAPAGDTVPLVLSAYGLTARESEVARLVLRGASTRAIVDTLHISAHTVQDHLKAVFDKAGVRSRRELVGQLLGQGPGSPV
jgi:DNA-binding CsgD family transcriptional regulator